MSCPPDDAYILVSGAVGRLIPHKVSVRCRRLVTGRRADCGASMTESAPSAQLRRDLLDATCGILPWEGPMTDKTNRRNGLLAKLLAMKDLPWAPDLEPA